MSQAGLARPPASVPPRNAVPTIETSLRAQVETLASPAFGGRRPGTEGETRTLRYLAKQWFDMGMESGTNLPASPWFAPVELVTREPVLSRALFVRGHHRLVGDGKGVLVLTTGIRNLVENAPVVVVGRGEMPSRTDLAGRIAMVFDSMIEAKAREKDKGRAGDRAKPVVASAPDAAGRLLDAGAMAVITVLDGSRRLDDVAANRLKAGNSLPGEHLENEIEAFVTPEFADRLLGGSAAQPGAALDALRKEAGQPDFVPRPIGVTATLEATSKETRIRTHNLIGRIPGRNPQAGAVLLVAHWDHFGACRTDGTICPGAVDNASGLAVITEAARQILHPSSKGDGPGSGLDRDVYVLATTGEEMGLLGALAFAENPPLPLERIVAAFNVDSTGLVPAGGPVAIVGKGLTPLDGDVEKVVSQMRRRMADGAAVDAAAGAYVRRQDSWVFLQHDVPAIMVSTSYGDPARLQAFMGSAYHTPADTPDAVNYAGMADDVAITTDLVRHFADTRAYPGSATTRSLPAQTNTLRTP